MSCETKHQLPTLRDFLGRIHERLILLAVTLAAISCALVGAVVIHKYEVRNLQLTANSTAYTVEPALLFSDLEAIRAGVVEIADQEALSKVLVVGPDQEELTHWEASRSGWTAPLEAAANRMIWPTPYEAKIRFDQKDLGAVQVFGSSATLLNYFGLVIALTLICQAMTLLMTRKLASRLHGNVIRPLQQIAETAYAIRSDRNFAERIPGSGIKEIDRFSKDFNAIVGELQERHHEIALENKELSRKATHDALTGLRNRTSFDDQLNRALAKGLRVGAQFSVIFLDADKFKPINDNFGHHAGDIVLRAIASRLGSMGELGFEAFRLGGDEFAIILEQDVGKVKTGQILERILDLFNTRVDLPCGATVPISVSLGAATFPANGRNSTSLLNHADQAMYRHKSRHSLPVKLERIHA